MRISIRRGAAALVSMLIAAANSGCERPPTAEKAALESHPALAATWPARARTDGGNFTVTVQPTSGSITRNQHFALEISVEPINQATPLDEVAVDADMPSHGHGMNTKPVTTHEGGSRYRTEGMLFHMAGDWSIMVELSHGAAKERAFFPVTIE